MTRESPIETLRAIRKRAPGLSNFDLSFEFADKHVGIDSEATQSIWYWTDDGRETGIGDDELNAILVDAIEKLSNSDDK